MLELLANCPAGTFDTALLAGGWNLLEQSNGAVLQECARRGVAVHLAHVFGGGGSRGQVCH